MNIKDVLSKNNNFNKEEVKFLFDLEKTIKDKINHIKKSDRYANFFNVIEVNLFDYYKDEKKIVKKLTEKYSILDVCELKTPAKLSKSILDKDFEKLEIVYKKSERKKLKI